MGIATYTHPDMLLDLGVTSEIRDLGLARMLTPGKLEPERCPHLVRLADPQAANKAELGHRYGAQSAYEPGSTVQSPRFVDIKRCTANLDLSCCDLGPVYISRERDV
mmetsp:Transcript_13985/g.30240  ORF Transcript_13985/g.30240 Transcript_13985/m.30240 type:complete len:107 (+) Transcript_13985:637-957(+)